MAQIPEELDQIRWQLAELVGVRLVAGLTPGEQARYDQLCQRERVLLHVEHGRSNDICPGVAIIHVDRSVTCSAEHHCIVGHTEPGAFLERHRSHHPCEPDCLLCQLRPPTPPDR